LCLGEVAVTLLGSICFSDNGAILSEFGKVGVDWGGLVIAGAGRLADEFNQLIYSEIYLFFSLMAYTDQ
jgi:hypothetical protein